MQPTKHDVTGMPLYRMYPYQYVPVRCDWPYIPLFCLLIQYRKLFWKVLRNNLKIFKRKIGKFRELLQRIRGIFPKILRIILKNIENHFKQFRLKFRSFREIIRMISENFEKYFVKFRELFLKILRIKSIWKIFKII